MRLVSMLHRLYPQKGFVYGKPIFAEHAGQQAIRVPLRPRKGSRPTCAGCGQRGPGYDQLAERSFQFVPLWGLAVFFMDHRVFWWVNFTVFRACRSGFSGGSTLDRGSRRRGPESCGSCC
jgi:hypothetical protein